MSRVLSFAARTPLLGLRPQLNQVTLCRRELEIEGISSMALHPCDADGDRPNEWHHPEPPHRLVYRKGFDEYWPLRVSISALRAGKCSQGGETANTC